MREDRFVVTTRQQQFAVGDRAAVLACFDATAARLFAWICLLVGGDRDLAEVVLADVYLQLQQAATDENITEADDEWLVTTAFRLVDQCCRAGEEPNREPPAELVARDRAMLDLGLDQQRSDDEIGRIVGIPAGDVAAAVKRAAHLVRSTECTEAFADVLRRSERWLDDTTRRRTRSAIIRGERPRSAHRPPVTREQRDNSPIRTTTRPLATGPDRERKPIAESDDLRPPKRLLIGVAIGIAALFVSGLLAIGPADRAADGPGDDNAAAGIDSTDGTSRSPSSQPASTQRATQSTVQATVSGPVGTVSDPGPAVTLGPGYVLGKIPAGFTPAQVWEQVDQRGDFPPDGWFQLWAAPGSSRTRGRWFAVAVSRWGYSMGLASGNSTRISINGRFALLSTERDGLLEIRLQVGGSWTDRRSVNVLGFGLTVDELQQIAGAVRWQSIEPTTDYATVGSLEFDTAVDAMLVGMAMLVSTPSNCCDVRSQLVESGDVRAISYRSTSAAAPVVDLTVSTRTGSDHSELLIRFLEPSSPDPSAPANLERTVQVGDRTVTITGDVLSSDVSSRGVIERVYNTARWTEGAATIVVSGEIDLATLLAAIPSVHLATAIDWRELSRTPPSNPAIVDRPPAALRHPVYHKVGKTTLADGSSWLAVMSVGPDMIKLVQNDGNGSGAVAEMVLDVTEQRPVHEYLSYTATVLVVALREPGAGTAVRITVAGRDPVTISLTEIGGVYAAIDAFSELPPYTAELVDDAGTSVRLITP